ncbi:cytochrome c1 [Sansalvadorimonas sp. 2012CJ34-2]|uniref:Cytochrome c1 n=1 Tax=Parendozoicomonas callyspongiae TaxID=2942213 RepID=A0ABT0PCG2_9GAMM|nr:cytochrome c1 [Sansalvadorimonas sp. 2012CJ34-2]MCL6268988.1 cytochrome c1 [Sansalvadorimonas sp. 2012CJ34-2]
MKRTQLLKRTIAVLMFAVLPLGAFAASGGYPLDEMVPDMTDKASLQRGAKTYMNYCYGCHATGFQRYERVADDLGIPHDLMMENLMPAGGKIGDLMTNGMDPKESKNWFGATPPDLTLVARVRGTDWLYTYLRTFYLDPKRPYGVNNKVFPDVGMPHVLLELQGAQVDTCGGGASQLDTLTGEKLCGLEPDSSIKGSMTPGQFDQAMYDLVNFLSYSGEPMQLERQRLGIYVLLFLLVFFVVAYLLKREYWKDVH